ncbi:hypothetical protein HID58_029394 [Brassica napus]|uniref:Uncharacterized protein n=1 Tax=Brassica napus TaxID=3708 RepID=A0ABQ8CEN4_BRANA|nr:hypothetical protein HID58_029394 [Brassica napus]
MIEGDQRRVRPTPAGVETHRRGINIHLDTTPTLDLREKTLETEEANNIRLSFRDMCKRAINPGSDRRARSTRSQGFGSHREGNEPSTEPARNSAELSPLVGGAPPTGNPNSVPKDAVELAIVEVREAMAQYTACADPTESAARKERMRLAEAQGHHQWGFQLESQQFSDLDLLRKRKQELMETLNPRQSENQAGPRGRGGHKKAL